MSVDPPGPAPSDAPDPAPADRGPVTSPSTAKVKAGRAAAGPKRTPRPKDKERSSTKPQSVRRPQVAAAVVAPSAAPPASTSATSTTTVVDRTELDPLDGAPSAPVADDALPAAPAKRARAPKAGSNRAVRRGRRVKRVVRRIDLWSVLKLSLVVYTCLYLAVMATLAALWSLLYTTDTIDKITSFLADVGLENFHFYGDQMFRACAAIGAVGVMAGTIITVLATALVNVISEITGGIRLIVIEEEPPA